MPHFLNQEIERLKKLLITISSKTEEAVHHAGKALLERDPDRARSVIEDDHIIDRLEVETEEECLKSLVLYQPVADDLRFIITILKVNNDLERIGDLAVNLAERVKPLAEKAELELNLDFAGMLEKTSTMLRNSLSALVHFDKELAVSVLEADDDIDAMNKAVYEQVKATIGVDREQSEVLIHSLTVSRTIERIADHATNIAQDVLYLIEGEIVRHRK